MTSQRWLELDCGNDVSVEFHRKYGGWCLPGSSLNRQGGGFLDKNTNPSARGVNVYRTDLPLIEFPSLYKVRRTIGEMVIYAPVSLAMNKVVEKYPVVLIKQKEALMVPHQSLLRVLREGIQFAKERRVKRSFCKKPGEVFDTKRLRVKHYGVCEKKIDQVIEALLRQEMLFEWPKGARSKSKSIFWNRLGLFQIEKRFYKIAKQVCTAVYSSDELETEGRMQQVAPVNVKMLGARFYVQEDRAGTFAAVAQFGMRTNKAVEASLALGVRQAMRLMNREVKETVSVLKDLRKKSVFSE